jgi:hypothetical protein
LLKNEHTANVLGMPPSYLEVVRDKMEAISLTIDVNENWPRSL